MKSHARVVTQILFGLLMAGTLAVVGAGTAQASQGGFFETVNTGTGTCADVWHNSTAPGARVRGNHCHGGDNQLWALAPIDNGYYEVVNRHSGLCFELPNDTGENGTPIEQAHCLGYLTEQWQVINPKNSFPPGETTFGLKNRFTGKCLDLDNDSPANGTQIQIWDCYDIPAQTWTLQ